MKVVITSEGSTMEDPVDPRFGRCRTFLLADTDDDAVRSVPNDAAMQPGGAGIQAAENVVNLGAEAVITGQLGPKAARVLQAASIPVYGGASGTVRDALEAFKEGRLHILQQSGSGRGMGARRGRGMERGGGRRG
jgi:predicted Fe-Mo cluster-binding NifX family protein